MISKVVGGAAGGPGAGAGGGVGVAVGPGGAELRNRLTPEAGMSMSSLSESQKSPRGRNDDGPRGLPPPEGYCFIFARDTPQFEVVLEGERLVVHEKPEFNTPTGNILTDLSRKLTRVEIEEEYKQNLLCRLTRGKALYEIQPSPDGKYYAVVVSMAIKDAEKWADEHDIDIEIEPKEAVRVGRDIRQFTLAHRTYLPHLDESDTLTDGSMKFRKLSLELWDQIHIPFEPSIDPKVYKVKGHQGSVLDNRLFLRILFEHMTADEGSGGCGFNIDAMRMTRGHPLVSVFATNDPQNDRPTLNMMNMMPTAASEEQTVQDIREYYGEMTAFYFAFLLHYQRCLLYAIPVGFVFFIAQAAVDDIAVPGSLFLVILAVIWSTITIETWYRRENTLQYQWGMTRYSATEVPRPGFQGILELSRVTGEVVEVISSRLWYIIKILLSLSGILCCIACVIAVVAAIWTLKRRTTDNTMSILIGMLNAVQITIFNYIYVYLASWLNEVEGHRLQEEWYNHLVVKRVFFLIVNSFNSLFYLAFIEEFDSNHQCLKAVRIQLVTLFLSMIFIQNTMEVFVPKMMVYVYTWLGSRQEQEAEERLLARSAMNQPHVVVRIGEESSVGDHRVDNERKEEEDVEHNDLLKKDKNKSKDLETGEKAEIKKHKMVVEQAMWDDVWAQFHLLDAPTVLDNTAEIVVQYGYIMLFVLVFPLMFLLAAINNFIEFRLDFYGLTQSRRNVPYAASGIGVWKQVMSAFGTVAVFSNLSILTWRTNLAKLDIADSDDTNKVIYFFGLSFLLLWFQFIARFWINDITPDTQEALGRQEACEKYLLLGEIKKSARRNKTLAVTLMESL